MKFLQKKLEKVLKNKIISGVKDGEKIIVSQNFDHLIFLSSNFVSAGKIKRGLEGFGKKVEIVSNTRESDDEKDKNLIPFISSINKYLNHEIDALVFLPCSAMVKFDLDGFSQFMINKGDTISLSTLEEKLIELGYDRTSLVSQVGEFAVRGDILDIFTEHCENPYRIEFFDDFIEKISIFDANSMKNVQNIDNFIVSPLKFPAGENDIFDMPGHKIIDEPKKISEEFEMLNSSYQTMSFYDEKNYVQFDKLLDKTDMIFDNFAQQVEYENDIVPEQNYLTDFLALKQDILSYKKMNQSIILFTGAERFSNSIKKFLTENGINWNDANQELKNGEVYVSDLMMPYSFSFLKEGVIGIGADNLFRSNNISFSKSKHSVFYLPKLGDFVVHTFHGIGKCIKIEKLKISDIEKDYFVLEYKNGDILYLPTEETNSISAYIGSEESPKLSSLGGAEFSRLKDRVRASVKEMALSLVEIYKERNEIKGYRFNRDEYLEKKFADEFPFTESIDQLKAIQDIDNDMESDKVMDRLICGDVGFGKTEVALRACFKAIYNGKQVALLCPTTILSEQHYRTARERLEPFGIKVEVLNRFKTPLQVKQILNKLENGEIDMIVGTHRMLSNDVKYKDLGLLVLDEEQRFGVEHKEKIKDQNRNIDVLTLSATPIPRTLNMSLSGIRDISIIETPPKDRLPIQTYLAPESEQLLKDVLSRELARNGQAFVIYNRVETIEEFAGFIRRIMPSARVGVAHGQMQEKTLEGIINKLYEGQFDILVSTTLIENGIDLPSANTMVVIDSDRLGLSQLYQLRGRIGRSDKLGYAYLTYDENKILTEDAYKRLEAIKEFSTLGSGFKIAMRDLEIRGAGNIFGKQQHGHIAKVGYDMFVKILDEEIKEIKGEKLNKKSDVKLEVSLSAFLSEDYVAESEERIIQYTRIADISSQSDMDDVIKSLEDGYGIVPTEVKNLCYLAYLRNIAGEFDVEKIKINKEASEIILSKKENIIDERLSLSLSKFNAKLSFDSLIKIKFNGGDTVIDKVLTMIKFFEVARAENKNN